MKEFRFALWRTLPILFSYIFLGIAFGILVQTSGLHWGWAAIISLVLFTGAFQFILIGLLANQVDLGTIALTALLVNSRNLFYGIPFVKDFPRMGWRYPLMIHLMSDETFAVLLATEVPAELDRDRVRFLIALLNGFYWTIGSLIGGLLGNVLPFDLTGIDFSLTALFVTIFLDQWRSFSDHRPALIGLGVSLLALLIFGPRFFLLPALLVTVAGLLMLRPRLRHHA